MRHGSAFNITKLLRELTRGDLAITAAEHETKTRRKHGKKRVLMHRNPSAVEKMTLN